MKKILIMLALALILTACRGGAAPTTAPAAAAPTEAPAQTTVPPTTLPPHSQLYDEGLTIDEVVTYFNEVVLQIEYTDGPGDPSLVQKWLEPMRCRVYGEATEEDLQILQELSDQLNRIEGFPGLEVVGEDEIENLTISFLDPDTFRDSFSDVVHGEDAFGAVQFWYYTDTNEIYTARIGCRTDLDPEQRRSVLLEEVVNALGLSDSELRSDSIVYQYSNENTALSKVDVLILKLMYHPDIHIGMDAEQCERILRELYY